jgi:hypothetical protein
MQLQKINVKLFTDAPATLELAPFLDIFARWRGDASHPSQWIDLADYAHVTKGPGIMLIGKQGNLALDLRDPGPGILYANKAGLEGSVQERILEVFRRCLALTLALSEEPEYPQALAPRPGFWELAINDRLKAPNTDATDLALRPAIESTLARLFGSDHTLLREADLSRLYGFVIHAKQITDLETFGLRLQAPTVT